MTARGDANTAVPGDRAFVFIGSASFTAPGPLRAVLAPEGTCLPGNPTGTGGSNFMVFVRGVAKMTADDFFL